MEAGSIRQKSKSDYSPGSASAGEEFRISEPSAARVAPGTAASIAPTPRSTGSSIAKLPVASSNTTSTLLCGQRPSHEEFSSTDSDSSGGHGGILVRIRQHRDQWSHRIFVH